MHVPLQQIIPTFNNLAASDLTATKKKEKQ
jgi:hypothetical protein